MRRFLQRLDGKLGYVEARVLTSGSHRVPRKLINRALPPANTTRFGNEIRRIADFAIARLRPLPSRFLPRRQSALSDKTRGSPLMHRERSRPYLRKLDKFPCRFIMRSPPFPPELGKLHAYANSCIRRATWCQ